MINTKLILLEGLPGSGKTTISKKIHNKLDKTRVNLVQEYMNPHPVIDWSVENIDRWIQKTLDNRKIFTGSFSGDNKIIIMEAAFFQNTISEMLLDGCSEDKIMCICFEIVNIIDPLKPVIILYMADRQYRGFSI